MSIALRHDYAFTLPTGSTPVPQMQPWLIPVVVIIGCVLVLICITVIIIGVVVALNRRSGKGGSTLSGC